MSRDKVESHVEVGKIQGPMTDLSAYKDVVIPEEIERFKNNLYQEFLEPYKLEIPAYGMKQIYEASMTDDAGKRAKLLEKAKQSFHLRYLSAWSKGAIKIHDEETKPMPDNVKQQLRELNAQRREQKKTEREEREIRKRELDKAEGKASAPKRSKIPVFQDPDQQKLVLSKYPWAVPGSFRQDAEKAGGTNVDILCACGATRTVHLADCFQVKRCSSCRGK